MISAHYDHEGIKNGNVYNGADDNASGISALIAFVEYLKKQRPKHSIIIAAFHAEELGFKGANYFVDHSIIPLENVKLNLNMDMIGRSDSNELHAVGSYYYKKLGNAIPEKNEGLKIVDGEHEGNGTSQSWTYSSNHASFHLKGIPFLYFGVDSHKDYHKPIDDFESIQSVFYQNAVYHIISIFNTLDKMPL